MLLVSIRGEQIVILLHPGGDVGRILLDLSSPSAVSNQRTLPATVQYIFKQDNPARTTHSGLHSMAPPSSASRNNQEHQLYTSSGVSDGECTHQEHQVLTSIGLASYKLLYQHQLCHSTVSIQPDKKRSKSCFPKFLSHPSNEFPFRQELDPALEVLKWTHGGVTQREDRLKKGRTATWQKRSFHPRAAATVVLVKDVDSSSDEDYPSDHRKTFDDTYDEVEDGNLPQDRGRTLATRYFTGSGQENSRYTTYEESVSPFSLGSRASSCSTTSKMNPQDCAGHQGCHCQGSYLSPTLAGVVLSASRQKAQRA